MSLPAEVDPPPGRIASIDVLRGLDVLLMLFVNELAGVRGAPRFLLHTPPSGDGITITDVVFPAFLFIMGMAIPLAIGGRLARGQTRGGVARHVLTRGLALLVMGLLMVNGEHAGDHGPLSPELWNALLVVGIVMVWGTSAVAAARFVRALGMALLLLLALGYPASDGVGLLQLRPYYWGILGLIGWSYLVSAAVYLALGDRPAALVGGVVLLYCVYVGAEIGHVAWLNALEPHLIGRWIAAHAAVALSGTALGVGLVRERALGGAPSRIAKQALGHAAAFAAAGLLLHTAGKLDPGFWVNKVLATPPWCLLSSAWTCLAWTLVYWLVDVKGWRPWRVVSMAGENALVAYLLPLFLLSVFALSAPLFGGLNPYETLGRATSAGFVRAAVFAWVVVRLGGWLRSRGVRLQL